MAYESIGWQCKDGTRMYACVSSPEHRESVRAVVGIVHGMGEHTDLYLHVAEMLHEQGIAVLMFDQRGHGRTEGQRGHTPSYDHLLEGIELLLEEAKQRYPGCPVILYGHSLGGNVVLNYLLRKKPNVSGAVISSPWLKLSFEPPRFLVAVGRLMEWIYPNFSNNRPMRAQNLTSDPVMVRRIEEDPIRHGSITPKFFFGVIRAGRWAIDHAAELQVPVLLMHGGDDKVTSLEASKLFAGKAGDRCEYKEWPHFKHELQNETDRADVFAFVASWLNRRLD